MKTLEKVTIEFYLADNRLLEGDLVTISIKETKVSLPVYNNSTIKELIDIFFETLNEMS